MRYVVVLCSLLEIEVVNYEYVHLISATFHSRAFS
jgi:hypothetical protein